MSESIPHYLLMSEARATAPSGEADSLVAPGQWRFVLESADGQALLEIDEEEFESDQERLDLIAVVRGLEALDQPSRVTLVTSSSYVNHGFRYGLDEWRENEWQWERFGEMAPVKNSDLWRRVDRALRFHRVDCRSWRFDRGHVDSGVPSAPPPASTSMPRTGARATPPAPHFDRSRDHAREATFEASRRPQSHGESSLEEHRLGNETADMVATGTTVLRRPRFERDNVRKRSHSRFGTTAAVRNPAASAVMIWHICRRWLAGALRDDAS